MNLITKLDLKLDFIKRYQNIIKIVKNLENYLDKIEFNQNFYSGIHDDIDKIALSEVYTFQTRFELLATSLISRISHLIPMSQKQIEKKENLIKEVNQLISQYKKLTPNSIVETIDTSI
ncbi:MAG: hypothetical protein E7374_01915 [Clostridiales bacterium]|nr:hypothetical protein [Clostridiales bacterium]